MPPAARLLCGLLIGCTGLVAMARLVSGAFTGGSHLVVWLVTAAVMLGWVGYAGWRAVRSRVTVPAASVVLLLVLLGSVVGWFAVGGAVLALVCSLVAFGVVWWHDRPARRPRRPVTLHEQ